DHTQDSALKILKILTSVVIPKAYELKNANYKTFVKYKAVSVQLFKRKMALSAMSMNRR
ncbi:hypothetical protein EDC96DRAFT_430818, partial [Choanephora cucurbitarum]